MASPPPKTDATCAQVLPSNPPTLYSKPFVSHPTTGELDSPPKYMRKVWIEITNRPSAQTLHLNLRRRGHSGSTLSPQKATSYKGDTTLQRRTPLATASTCSPSEDPPGARVNSTIKLVNSTSKLANSTVKLRRRTLGFAARERAVRHYFVRF
eukprot:1196178-Prorocentrum_minimum.AAC.3